MQAIRKYSPYTLGDQEHAGWLYLTWIVTSWWFSFHKLVSVSNTLIQLNFIFSKEMITEEIGKLLINTQNELKSLKNEIENIQSPYKASISISIWFRSF